MFWVKGYSIPSWMEVMGSSRGNSLFGKPGVILHPATPSQRMRTSYSSPWWHNLICWHHARRYWHVSSEFSLGSPSFCMQVSNFSVGGADLVGLELFCWWAWSCGLGPANLCFSRLFRSGVKRNRGPPGPSGTRLNRPKIDNSHGNRYGSWFQFTRINGYQSDYRSNRTSVYFLSRLLSTTSVCLVDHGDATLVSTS